MGVGGSLAGSALGAQGHRGLVREVSKGTEMGKKRKSTGGWSVGLTNVLMLLKGACRQHGVGLDETSPYKMASALFNVLRIQAPDGMKSQKQVIWLYELLVAKGYKRAPYAKSVRPKPIRTSAPTLDVKREFYASWEWQTLRKKALNQHGAICQCCGAVPGGKTIAGIPVVIHVDHIKPLSRYWHLRLEPDNLQILCAECNKGKGAWDETDHRPAPEEDAEIDEVDTLMAEFRAIMKE